jgi:hypothetical protein
LEQVGAVLLFLSFVALAIGVVYLVHLYYKKRREALIALAQKMELNYSPKDIFNIPERFSHLDLFNQGDSRKAYDLLYGEKDGTDVLLFAYKYTIGSGKNSSTYYLSVCILTFDVRFPYLIIRPEGFFDKVASFVGFDDIDFESAEFSRKFFVKSANRKFAYDIVHPQMMEFLLSVEGANVEIGGGDFLFHYGKAISIPQWTALYNLGQAFIKKIPDYVLDIGKSG